jgi:hypothetical protein
LEDLIMRQALRIALIAAVLCPAAAAQFTIDWHTIDAGGGDSVGGAFQLSGTIGQHDAGPSGAMSGGSFTLVGGFWPGVSTSGAPPCPADFDDSGSVNGLDLALLLGQWTGAAAYSPCPPHDAQDLNSDCKVNGLDLALLLGAWGPCP